MYRYNAVITDVYDGDTATAVVDLGFRVRMEIKLRLFGINAPELRGESRPEGLKSKSRLRELILNKDVVIDTHKDSQEKYGRWLATIFVGENNVNQILVDEGLAIKYMDQ